MIHSLVPADLQTNTTAAANAATSIDTYAAAMSGLKRTRSGAFLCDRALLAAPALAHTCRLAALLSGNARWLFRVGRFRLVNRACSRSPPGALARRWTRVQMVIDALAQG